MHRSSRTFIKVAGIVFLLSSQAIAADRIEGRVSRVVDGDTVIINEQRIRIWGISAPERNENYGPEATKELASLVKDKTLSCDVKYIDPYKRPVALCMADNVDIAEQMVMSGFAKDWSKYSGRYYEKHQISARQGVRGLWGEK